MRIINKTEIEQILTMEYAVEAVQECFLSYYKKEAALPVRTRIEPEGKNGKILFMPAYLPSSEGLGVKVVSVYPENREKGFQTIFSTILLNDPDTGRPLAVMDGEHITAIRTGAVTAVAARLCTEDKPCNVALFGTGVQGMTQLEGIFSVREVENLFIFSRNQSNVENFINELKNKSWYKKEKEKGKLSVLVGNMKKDVPEADIIITATTSAKPVFPGSLIKPGAFISAVGGFTSEVHELEPELVARARIIIDSREGALKEAGDVLIPIQMGLMGFDDIIGDLGEALNGSIKIRKSREDIVIFKSVGLALQDMAIAPFVLRRAIELGLGIETHLA